MSAIAAAAPILATDEIPLHRLRSHGAGVLSDAELVAVLTRTRVRTDADLYAARALLRDGLAALVRLVDDRAATLPPLHAARLAAAFELARRAFSVDLSVRPLYDTDTAGRMLAARYGLRAQEHVGVLLLDGRNRIVGHRIVFVGTVTSAFVSTRDVVRIALANQAAKVVLFHNHPSGDPGASGEDLAFTVRQRDALQIFDIALEDHLIVAGERVVSLRGRGFL
jgi:DNA repair proteins